MRIGIAHWQGRVSPVFDVSDRLLLIDLENGRETHRENIFLSRRDPFERAKEVVGRRIDVLLCGAVSRIMETALTDAGVQVLGFICGDLETIFKAFLEERLSEDRFLMPGCKGKRKSPRLRRGGAKKKTPRKQSRRRPDRGKASAEQNLHAGPRARGDRNP